jgi:uncharacterized protein YbjQ (UPF0145 family)
MTEPTLDPVAAARLADSGKVFTSDLSVAEFTTLESLGFRPLDLVMGVSVYHIGWQNQSLKQSQELTTLTHALYEARHNAMNRLQAEANALGADGVVGVRLEWRQHGEAAEHIEFIAVGTAVSCTASPRSYARPDGHAFTSHLNVHEFALLLRSGWIPTGFVLGSCVWHIAAQGFMQTMRQVGQNVEMPQWTQGNYEAREMAMTRMQAEAEAMAAEGVTGVRFSFSNYLWGLHTMEFYCDGTAIRKIAPDAKPVTPTVVVSVD